LTFNSCQQDKKALVDAIHKTAIINNDSVHYLAYIPPNQCKNCFQFTCDSSYDHMKDRVHIILNQDTTYFRGFKHAYLEKDKLFFSNDLVNKGNKIIVYKDNEILDIVKLDHLEWIKDYDKKYYKY